MIKKFVLTLALPLASFLKRILTFIRNNVLPSIEPSNNKTPYNLYREEEIIHSYNHFKKFFKSSILINQDKIGKYAIKAAKKNDTENNFAYLEFGVWKGATIKLFSKYVDKIYGFDSFQGLNEDWVGHKIAANDKFKLEENKIPSFPRNVVIVKGIIQNTLEDFLKKNNPKINFIHIDTDTYETCKFILNKTKPYLVNNAVILFDELYNFPGWDVGEYKALKECFESEEYQYKVFSADRTAVAIQIKKK